MESGFQRLAPRARTHGIRPHAVSHRFRSGCEARSADRGAGSIVVENGIVFDPVSRRLRSGLPGGGPAPQKAPDGSPGTPGRTPPNPPNPNIRKSPVFRLCGQTNRSGFESIRHCRYSVEKTTFLAVIGPSAWQVARETTADCGGFAGVSGESDRSGFDTFCHRRIGGNRTFLWCGA